MRRVFNTLLMLMMLILLIGCNRDASEDVYKDKETDVTDDTEPTTASDLTDSEDENPEDNEAPSESGEKDEPSDTSDENKMETPVDDVYEFASEPVEFDFSAFEGIEPLVVEDEETIGILQAYLEDFYFNYYFYEGVDKESGNIGADAMTLFALSYIMQYEREELRFDYENFILFIPADHVISVIQEYFYRQLDVFEGYEELGISYEDDMYSVIVEGGEWDVDLEVDTVEKLGDFTYLVKCNAVSKASGMVRETVEAVVDESHEGLVLINYIVDEAEE